jgi:hypothetical protein
MPYKINTRETFAAMLLLSSGPRMRYGTDEQDITQNGERKWSAELAVTMHPEAGRRPVSEVISVGLIGGNEDPARSIMPGTPVEVDGFQVGVMAPEKREGSNRISGGKAYFSATAIRPAAGVNGQRQPVGASKGE